MPQVPYTPVPSQTLEPIATPEMHPAIPEAAFGGQVAQAEAGFGKTTSGVGDEIFSRAIALQNLQNETDAKNADANYMIAAGKLHADYGALQGKDRVDAYPKLVQDLQSARVATRNTLGTSMAQKMYDASALQTMGRTIFNAAGAAATAQKEYTINSATAKAELDAKSVEDDPRSPQLFDQKLAATRSNVATIAGAKGLGDDEEKLLQLKATSRLWSQRLIGLSREAPFEAANQLDKVKSNLTQEDYLKVDNIVRNAGRAVGSQNIANDIFSAGRGDDTTPPKPLSVMESEARAAARKQSPDDPILEQHAVAAVRGIYNQETYAKKQEDVANTQTVQQAIIQSGAQTVQQLRADPMIAAAIDASPKSFQLSLPGRLNTYNSAKDKIANEEHFRTLMGQSNNDVEGFLSADPFSDKSLNQSQMKSIAARQAALKKDINQDPRVDRAMGWMRGAMGTQMEALGVYKRTNANKDDYDHLTGAVQGALDIWQENHGKPPTYKEFQEQIAPQVIQQRAEPGWLWGTNKKPFYQQDTDPEFAAKVRADVVSKGGVEPTDEELNRAFIRTQLIKLYGSKKKSDGG